MATCTRKGSVPWTEAGVNTIGSQLQTTKLLENCLLLLAHRACIFYLLKKACHFELTFECLKKFLMCYKVWVFCIWISSYSSLLIKGTILSLFNCFFILARNQFSVMWVSILVLRLGTLVVCLS